MAKKGTVTGIVQAPADPFGAIAKPAAPASAKKHDKPMANVLPNIKKLVDLFLKKKADRLHEVPFSLPLGLTAGGHVELRSISHVDLALFKDLAGELDIHTSTV
jgi:hypothetical protein